VEAAWGLALLLAFATGALLPITALALVLMTFLTVWSIKTGKAEDCGCYGDVIKLSMWQSIALNAVYFSLVAIAWASHPAAGNETWKLITVAVFAVTIAIVSRISLERQISTGRRLFQSKSPLKAGRQWESSWAGNAKLEAGDNLVAFLGPSCPYCKDWVRVLNVIHSTDALPPVTAIFGARSEAIRQFVEETGARVPITTISARKLNRLAPGVPTTVLIENGRIKEVWAGRMTAAFRNRFKTAFFPSGEERAEEPAASGAS
jgi:hypothetical protein